MMHLPPVPYTPPMYRGRPADKRALVWYRPQTPDFHRRWKRLFTDAQAALQPSGTDADTAIVDPAKSDAIAAKLDSDIRALFMEAVESVEIGGVAHAPGSVELAPQFIAHVVAGIAAGGYDDTYPKP